MPFLLQIGLPRSSRLAKTLPSGQTKAATSFRLRLSCCDLFFTRLGACRSPYAG
jgi:hypothetical protein